MACSFNEGFSLGFDVCLDPPSTTLCILVTDQNGNPIENATVQNIVNNTLIQQQLTSADGKATVAYVEGKQNLFRVAFCPYQPQIYYWYDPIEFGNDVSNIGGCWNLKINTCLELAEPFELKDSRFFQFTKVQYCLRPQVTDIEICSSCDIDDLCNLYPCSPNSDTYALPFKQGDVVKFIVDKDDINYDGADLAKVKLAITSKGVFVELDAGTITDLGGDQLYITTTIPCLKNCEYEFTFYLDDNDGASLDLVSKTNSTTDTSNDGTFEVSFTGGVSPYTYSIDGFNWQSSGLFENLSIGTYTVYGVDSNCKEATINVNIIETLTCADMQGFTIQDFINNEIQISDIENCLISELIP